MIGTANIRYLLHLSLLTLILGASHCLSPQDIAVLSSLDTREKSLSYDWFRLLSLLPHVRRRDR